VARIETTINPMLDSPTRRLHCFALRWQAAEAKEKAFVSHTEGQAQLMEAFCWVSFWMLVSR
jgi:hypothetical protein